MIEIERIEIVTPIQGRTGTVMAQRVETINGRTTYIEPVDLLVGFDGSQLPREVQQALAAIDAQQKATIDSLTSERDTLKQRVSELEQSLSSKTTEAESLQSQVQSLTDQVSTLTASNSEITQQLTTANQRIVELTAALPWNPRIMEARAFVSRITPSEMLSLAASQDPQVQQIVGMLTAWVANDWPIVLDSPEIQGAVPYLLSVGLVTENRVAELLRDCTREESYVADGV